jgi:hypothetical protein
MRTFWTLSTPHILLIFLGLGCEDKVKCRLPLGSWAAEGQELVFLPDGKGLWITTFGRIGDTVAFEFRSNCRAKLPTLDLVSLSGGPLMGKNLLGIMDWQSDSSFRWRYETGDSEEVRPKAFDLEHTTKFLKKH